MKLCNRIIALKMHYAIIILTLHKFHKMFEEAWLLLPTLRLNLIFLKEITVRPRMVSWIQLDNNLVPFQCNRLLGKIGSATRWSLPMLTKICKLMSLKVHYSKMLAMWAMGAVMLSISKAHSVLITITAILIFILLCCQTRVIDPKRFSLTCQLEKDNKFGNQCIIPR